MSLSSMKAKLRIKELLGDDLIVRTKLRGESEAKLLERLVDVR
jgi:hypothetical protein